MMSAEDRARMDSRADLIIRSEDGILHVFELKPQAQMDSQYDKGQARLQLEGNIAALNAAGGRAVAGDWREFDRLFTGGPQHVGEIVDPGLGRQIRDVVMTPSDTPGLLGYTLRDSGDSQWSRASRAVSRALDRDTSTTPFFPLPFPGPGGIPVPVP